MNLQLSRYLSTICILLLLTGCKGEAIFNRKVDLSDSYTLNFDGTTSYGTLDSPWVPTGANWEIQLELVWDSSVGANSYPIATNSSTSSIYIDSGGLPLLKYEGSYITSNVSRLVDGEFATVKFSVSATEVKCYFNNTLESTVATANTLSVPWTVVGAHATYISKFKGQIRKISLNDLDDTSNSRVLDFVFKTEDLSTLTVEGIRDSLDVDFILPAGDRFIEI
ncbi:hypothetical protein [Halobacteriovorax sp.]|uniref:hypothetical protein n=1 Tax=Halobacteriovorax sp. TaxID=2020862 RepID=UPI0035654F59